MSIFGCGELRRSYNDFAEFRSNVWKLFDLSTSRLGTAWIVRILAIYLVHIGRLCDRLTGKVRVLGVEA